MSCSHFRVRLSCNVCCNDGLLSRNGHDQVVSSFLWSLVCVFYFCIASATVCKPSQLFPSYFWRHLRVAARRSRSWRCLAAAVIFLRWAIPCLLLHRNHIKAPANQHCLIEVSIELQKEIPWLLLRNKLRHGTDNNSKPYLSCTTDRTWSNVWGSIAADANWCTWHLDLIVGEKFFVSDAFVNYESVKIVILYCYTPCSYLHSI